MGLGAATPVTHLGQISNRTGSHEILLIHCFYVVVDFFLYFR